MNEDLEDSSQFIEEEQDFFFDDDSIDHEEELATLSQQDLPLTTTTATDLDPNNEESFKRRLAGPSTNKAGMEDINRDKVNGIIYEASKGSAFFENEKKRNEAVTKRIDTILKKYELIKHQDLLFEQRIVDSMIQDLEETRDLTQCIVHVDMDAFYASVEELENPGLKEIPMAVGDVAMLCTSNYHARKFGVRSGMPGFIALKLCPQLKMIPLHFPKYRAASEKVRDVFRKYDANFLPMSLDEAYLNVTEYLEKTSQTPSELVEQIRQEIFDATLLTASAGIACNKTLAKICSDINKPNGQYYLSMERSHTLKFVKDLKLRQIPGVGRVTERVLEALGVTKCGDIYQHRAILYKLLSPISFQFMLRNYLGIGSTSINSDTERKSMSVERTFSAMSQPHELFQKLQELSQLLEKDLEKENMMGKTISIKIKFVSFQIRIRSKTLPSYIWSAKDIEKATGELLKKELPVNLRLMGIRISTMKQRGSEDESLMKYFTKLPLLDPSTSLTRATTASTYQPKNGQLSSIPALLTINATNDTPIVTDDNETPLFFKQQHQEQKKENEESFPLLLCPICNRVLAMSNDHFNKHVDECLNKMEVKAILKDQMEKEKLANTSSSNSSNSSSKSELPVAKKPKRSNKNSIKRRNGKSLLDYYTCATNDSE